MSPATQVVLSGALTFGIPLVLAFRELRALRRLGRGGGPDRAPEPPAPQPLPVAPEGKRKQLPESLLIAARGLPVNASRERVPELV